MKLAQRMRTPVFWMRIIIAVATPVLAYFGLTGADFTTWDMVFRTAARAAENPYVVALAAASVWGVLKEPGGAGPTVCQTNKKCRSKAQRAGSVRLEQAGISEQKTMEQLHLLLIGQEHRRRGTIFRAGAHPDADMEKGL